MRRRRMLVSTALTALLAASGGVAHAARSGFGARIPRIGSATLPERYITTTDNGGEVDVVMETNPREMNIKLVRCDDESDISDRVTTIRANFHGNTQLADNVRSGTCFKLNIDAGTVDFFHVEGTLTY